LVLVLLVGVFAYGYGLVTVQYRIYPFSILKHIKDMVIADEMACAPKGTDKKLKAGKKKHLAYYNDRKSFFEVNGTTSDIVMIGDSITDGAEWNELFPKLSIVNRGISGDTTQGVLDRMGSIYSTNAKKAFIMIGVNDLGHHIPVEDIFQNYQQIVFKLKQRSITPYIQSTLLTGNKHAHHNKDIVKLNVKLKKLCEAECITYIDLNEALSENGKLKDAFSADDIHLNGKAYSVWKYSIKPYIH
jgi:lysophospholipase L1-like esterase